MVNAASVAPTRARQERRGRRWTFASVGLCGLAIVQFASMTILWFLPYHTTGLLNELGLVALGGVLGMAAFALLRRWPGRWPPRRAALCLGAAVYGVASMAGLGWAEHGPGFGDYRYALFSTADCDFTARFAAPPQLGRFSGKSFEADRPSVASTSNLALLADLRDFSSYRAECQPASGNALASDVLQAVNLQWARKAGINVTRQSLTRDGRGDIVLLEGEMPVSILPDGPGGKASTLVALRSYIGPRSIMTVYVFQPLGSTLSANSAAFLDGVRRR